MSYYHSYKGLSPLVSHVIYVSLSFILLIFVITSLSNTRGEIQKQYSSTEYSRIAESIKNGIIEFELLSKDSESIPDNGNFIILGRQKLNVPLAANTNVLIALSGNSIVVSGENNVVTRTIITTLQLSGSEYLPAYLQLRRQNNNGNIVNIVEVVA